MGKYKWIILFFVLVVSLIVIAVVFTDSEGKYIKEISLNEISNKIDKKEDFLLYIKQTDCTHCKAFTPKFISALKENKLTAYALNITDLSKEEMETYKEMFNVEGTPTVLIFKDGNENFIRIEGEQDKDKIVSQLKSADFIK